MKKFNVLVVDDHQMMRAGLERLIEGFEGCTVVAEAANGVEAIKMSKRHTPDIVVMDIAMPDMNGLLATEQNHFISAANQGVGFVHLFRRRIRYTGAEIGRQWVSLKRRSASGVGNCIYQYCQRADLPQPKCLPDHCKTSFVRKRKQ